MAEFTGDTLYRLISYDLFSHQIEGQLMVHLRLGESDSYGIGTNPSRGVSEVRFLLDRDELARLLSDLESSRLDFGDLV